MDYPNFDIEQISAKSLKISDERWGRYIEMLSDCGYIKGVRLFKNINDEIQVEDKGIRITLKGLEYLCDNSLMKRTYKALKGISEITKPND